MTTNKTPELLVLTQVYAPTLAALEREFVVHRLWTARDPDACVREVAQRVRGLVTSGLVGFQRKHLEALPRLEIVACYGNPHGTVDLDAARARGVIVTNTPDFNTLHVADHAMGLLISIMRKIGESERFARSGHWPSHYPPVSTGLTGKTCGIVGLGRIGRAVAARAAAFGMTIVYHGPQAKSDVAYRYYPDLEAMARDCDCLIVTCWLNDETRNLVGERILDALGPQGFLVNVARGPILEEAALIRALTERRIAAAGLDVFSNEPHIPAQLLALENVCVTPHVGTNTIEIREQRSAKLLANLRAHFAGEPVPYPMT